MRQEAELFGEEDNQRRELVELKNGAEAIFYQYENILRDNGDSLSEDLTLEAATKIAILRASIGDSKISLGEFKFQLEAIQQLLYAFGTAVYQDDQSGSSAPATPPTQAASQAAPSAAPGTNDPFAFDPEKLDTAQDETVRVDLNPFGDKDGNPFGGNNFDEDTTGTADYEAID